ncbi:unnamed protein product, partial [Didymodactylos carnosus]
IINKTSMSLNNDSSITNYDSVLYDDHTNEDERNQCLTKYRDTFDNKIHSPADSTDSGIQMTCNDDNESKQRTQSLRVDEQSVVLPTGWERFEDEEGVYYWQKRTGLVTRIPPCDIITPSSSTPTLSSSSSNEACYETGSLLYKSASNSSLKVKTGMNIEYWRFL